MTRTPPFAPPRIAPDAGTFNEPRPQATAAHPGTHFARPHVAPASSSIEQEGLGSRLRAMLLSVVALTLGVTAFGYALRQVHHILFVTSASAAKVAGPVYTIAMPREGTFYSLVPADNLVKRGAPLASFEAPVLDLVRGQALASNITAEQLAKLSSQMIKGTITSPCDCRVQATFAANAQYASRGQPLFELVPREIKDPTVMARFRFDQADKITPGTKVHFRVTGDGKERHGVVSQLRVPNQVESVGGDIIATIQPSDALPSDLVDRPAMVDVGGIANLNPFELMSQPSQAATPAAPAAAPPPATPDTTPAPTKAPAGGHP